MSGDTWKALKLGDCVEECETVQDGTVDAVIADPPYGIMQKTTNLWNGQNKYGWDVSLDPSWIFGMARRKLRPNGTLVLFGQEPYTSRLVTGAIAALPFSYRMIWKKNHFGNPLNAKKAPLSCFEDVLVFRNVARYFADHPLREYSKKVFGHIQDPIGTINAKIGNYGAVHFAAHSSTQFTLCSERVYLKLCELYGIDRETWFMEFTELKRIDAEFRDAQTSAYPVRFNLVPGAKYKINILEYPKEGKKHHPTQKPVALMEDLVRTYSDPGDTVMDFSMGSGSTGVACVRSGRNFIGVEKDPSYFDIAKRRIDALPE